MSISDHCMSGTWTAKLGPMRLMASFRSTRWSMEMTSGLAAAMRSKSPPEPLMYRMMVRSGCVCRTCSAQACLHLKPQKLLARCKRVLQAHMVML